MQAQQAPMIFTEAERQAGDRLMKAALETDRIEGYTEPHAVMIAKLAETIGRELGLHGIDLSALKFAALAHDLGERGMKRNYLLNPNALTWEERLDLWRHPILGEQAAGELKLSRQTQLLIRWHHEWWNGQGYPDGLSGEAIPLGARILRAVDSYCSLIAARPYRQAFDLAEAEQVIADLAGIEFDPQVARLLLMLVGEERRQREAELELQRQQEAFWNPSPQFEQSAEESGEFEEALPPDPLPVTEPVNQTSEETTVVTTAVAYESVLSFAETQSAEPPVLPVQEVLPAQETLIDDVVIPPDQMPTAEMPVVELPGNATPLSEHRHTAAELAVTRELSETTTETQN